MSSPTPAYQRIVRAGYDLEVRRADDGYLLHVTRNGERQFTEKAPRIGRLTIQQVRQKCRIGRWRSDSRMLPALDRLANWCENLTAAEAAQ